MRRGLPGSAAHLDEANLLATRLQDPPSRIPVAATRAERAWTQGTSGQWEIDRIWPLAAQTGQRWWLGELAWWAFVAGNQPPELPTTSTAHQLMLTGQWRAAADTWQHQRSPLHAGREFLTRLVSAQNRRFADVMPIALSVGWTNVFQSVERHSHVVCPGCSRAFQFGVSMTPDFLDPFIRTEIAYRQGKVFTDCALPGRRRTRAYRLKAPKKAVVSPTRTGFQQSEMV